MLRQSWAATPPRWKCARRVIGSTVRKPARNVSEQERTVLRREQIGFVFQHFGLLPTLTVAENVALPAFFARRRLDHRVKELLEKVGLSHRGRHRPHELSGGEMQRAAIARALVNGPQILLADEPTGNLDTATGSTIIDLFRQLNAEGLTIVVVTQNPALASAARRQIVLRDGTNAPTGHVVHDLKAVLHCQTSPPWPEA